MAEVLNLSLDRAEVDVVLSTKDGTNRKWKLRELDGKERNTYLNRLSNRAKMGKDGTRIGIRSFDGFQSDLLCLCLMDEQGELVDKQTIEELPSKTQHTLFKKAQELCGLDEKDDLKND